MEFRRGAFSAPFCSWRIFHHWAILSEDMVWTSTCMLMTHNCIWPLTLRKARWPWPPKLDGHVNKVFKVCMFHLRTISKIRRFLTIEACKLLIHALVTSRLDYCNSILYGCNQSVLQRLQLLQNYAARLVYKIPKFCHITPYLKDLHWLPVQARIQFKLLTIVFKCIHGNGPQYLSELLCRKMTRPGLRSANSIILYIPRTLSRAEQSTADRSFSISGPKLWNQLPVSIQNSCSLDVLKSRLKTFLFKKFFY